MMNLPLLPVCETTAVDGLLFWVLGTRLVDVVASVVAAVAVASTGAFSDFGLGFDFDAFGFVSGGLGGGAAGAVDGCCAGGALAHCP